MSCIIGARIAIYVTVKFVLLFFGRILCQLLLNEFLVIDMKRLCWFVFGFLVE